VHLSSCSCLRPSSRNPWVQRRI